MKREEYEYETRENVVLGVRMETGEIIIRITRDSDGVWSIFATDARQFPTLKGSCLGEFKDAESAMATFDKWMANIEKSKALRKELEHEREQTYMKRQQAATEYTKTTGEQAPKWPWYRRLFR